MSKANASVRLQMRVGNIPAWLLAKEIGVHENTIIRWLRTEMDDNRKERIETALEQLRNADFHLGLDSREPVPSLIIRRQEQARALLAAFEQWEKTALRAITDYFRLLHRAQLLLAPETPEDEPHPLFAESLQNLSTVEYYLYVLAYGTSSEKISFFKLDRKAVKQAEQRLRYWRNQGISF